jgi:hypothetical protein
VLVLQMCPARRTNPSLSYAGISAVTRWYTLR